MSYLGKTSLQAANIKRWTGTPGAVNVISFTTLGFNPLNEQSTFITINGVKQHDSSFVLTSAAISFSATLLAADEVEVVAILNVGQPLVPADNSVQRKHLAPSFRNVTQDKFSGNGVLTAFSLSYAPMSSASILVFLNGVSQLAGTDFTVSSTTLTFTTAPITGTDNVNVIHLTYATGTAEVIPPDASISDGKIVGMSSSKLTGALPALDGSALTSLTSGNLSGALPALDGSALTGVGVDGIVSTANATAITIDSNERVSVGGTPTSRLVNFTTTDQTDVAIISANNQWSQLCFGDPQDDNIGIVGYDNTNDAMVFTTNTVERMRITSTGNVGIGGTPYYPLDVVKNSSSAYSASDFCTSPTVRIRNDTSGANNYVSLMFGTESNGEYAIGAVQNSGNTSSDFVFASRNGGSRTERLRIDSAGRVTTPYQPAFQVHGTSFDNGANVFAGSTSEVNIGGHYSTSNGRFTAPIAGIYVFYFVLSTSDTNSHFVNITKNATLYTGNVAAYGNAYQNGTNVVVISLAANDYVRAERRGSGYGVHYCSFSGHLIG